MMKNKILVIVATCFLLLLMPIQTSVSAFNSPVLSPPTPTNVPSTKPAKQAHKESHKESRIEYKTLFTPDFSDAGTWLFLVAPKGE